MTNSMCNGLSDLLSCSCFVIHISDRSFFCLFLCPSLPLTFSICLCLSPTLSLSGLSPAQSEFNYLNTARSLELYGVELHYARVSKVLFCHC